MFGSCILPYEVPMHTSVVCIKLFTMHRANMIHMYILLMFCIADTVNEDSNVTCI